jgi:molybdate transport system ATP-binding protein
MVNFGSESGGDARELLNLFTVTVLSHDRDQSATRVAIDEGPELIIPFSSREVGSRVMVAIRGDDILLARQPVLGISARNQVEGVVDRIVMDGREAEVVVRTDRVRWIVSVVPRAIEELGLTAGVSVRLIVKARSCHVFENAPRMG